MALYSLKPKSFIRRPTELLTAAGENNYIGRNLRGCKVILNYSARYVGICQGSVRCWSLLNLTPDLLPMPCCINSGHSLDIIMGRPPSLSHFYRESQTCLRTCHIIYLGYPWSLGSLFLTAQDPGFLLNLPLRLAGFLQKSLPNYIYIWEPLLFPPPLLPLPPSSIQSSGFRVCLNTQVFESLLNIHPPSLPETLKLCCVSTTSLGLYPARSRISAADALLTVSDSACFMR